MMRNQLFLLLTNVSLTVVLHLVSGTSLPLVESRQEPDICGTPFGQTGICTYYERCPQLWRFSSYQAARSYLCGFNQNTPMFCCPTTNPYNYYPGYVYPYYDPSASATVTEKPSVFPGTCGVSNSTGGRIVGGEVSTPGAWPWMAMLRIDEKPSCGATLITQEHLITAGHCCNRFNPRRLLISVGVFDVSTPTRYARNYAVAKVTIHPDFSAPTFKNDICILKISQRVTFSRFVSPICLPVESAFQGTLAGSYGIITGWGTVAFNGKSSLKLMQASVEIYNQTVCKKTFDSIIPISDVYLCAGGLSSNKDACQGDSGGPLVMALDNEFHLIGVVSFGIRCASQDYPGVYTNVVKFVPWIESVVANDG